MNNLQVSRRNVFNSDPSYFARYKVEIMKRVAGRSPSAVLDFGCGIGRGTNHLRLAFSNARIVGCDVSSESLAMARNDVPGSEFVFPSEIQPGPHFDLILASCVFHHIPPDERQNAASLLLRATEVRRADFCF